MLRISRELRIGAIIVALISPAAFGAFTPSHAGNTSAAPLIDRDFESAVSKHISRRFFNRLGTTDEQREKLSKIINDTQEKSRAGREELRRGLLQLSDMMTDNNTSDEDIKTKATALRKLHEEIQDRRLDALLSARKVLNDEQKQRIHGKIKELIGNGKSTQHLSMSMDQQVNPSLFDD